SHLFPADRAGAPDPEDRLPADHPGDHGHRRDVEGFPDRVDPVLPDSAGRARRGGEPAAGADPVGAVARRGAARAVPLRLPARLAARRVDGAARVRRDGDRGAVHGGTILHPRGAGVLYHDAHLAAAALRADVRRDPGDVAAWAGSVSRGRSAGADRRALAAGGRELTICHEVGAELAPPMTAQVSYRKV